MISRGQMYRQLYQQGGEIMPRLNQLGSGVSSAEQTLQQIKQRLQSAESTLGSGGGNTAPIGSGFMQPVSMNNSKVADLRAIPEFMKDPSYQPIQNPLGLGGMLDKRDYSLQRLPSQQANLPQTLQPAINGPLTPISSLVGSRQSYMDGGQGIMSLDAGAPSIKYTGDIRPQVIMNAVPREEAFLGGVKKAIKKVTGAVKDVVKSDLGKAALGIAGLYYAPALLSGGALSPGLAGYQSGLGFAGNVLKSKLADIGLTSLVPKTALGRAGAIAAIGGLTGFLSSQGKSEEEIEAIKRDPNALKTYLRQYYTNLNPELINKPEMVEKFVQSQIGEYAYAVGGRVGYAMGDTAEMASNVEGLPFRRNEAGVGEVDMRETGGFIPPVGVKEKADDIPAMLSNNEFVFTADAVRGMGDGNVNRGAERMYALMKRLENGGRV